MYLYIHINMYVCHIYIYIFLYLLTKQNKLLGSPCLSVTESIYPDFFLCLTGADSNQRFPKVS